MRIRGEASPLLPWPSSPTAVEQGRGDDVIDAASVQNSVGEAPAGIML